MNLLLVFNLHHLLEILFLSNIKEFIKSISLYYYYYLSLY